MTTDTSGTNSDFWSVAANRSPNGGPPDAAADKAEITTAGAYTVTVDPA